MAISIDYTTNIISVPKNYTVLVQSSPTEIRDLDTNQFRLDLKGIEESEQGMLFSDTHSHNPPFQVGGIELARTVEILEPYTITFEDGPWAVNLKGSNNNILDRTNKNQVSVNPGNSAGLVTSTAIEFGEYGGAITVDQANSTGNATTGTVYPCGTLRRPSLDFDDVELLCSSKGFSEIILISDATIGIGHVLQYKKIRGFSHVYIDLLIEDAAAVDNTTIVECKVDGVMDGMTSLKQCVIGNITYLNGHIQNCSLNGKITLGGSDDAYITNCSQLDMNVEPEIDMGGSGQNLVFPNYTGLVHITNMSGSNKVGIGLIAGRVILETSSITSGLIHVSGVGILEDTDGNEIKSGTWNGGVTIINELMSLQSIKDSVLNGVLSEYTDSGTLGFTVNSIEDKIDIIDTNVDEILVDTSVLDSKIDIIDTNIDFIKDIEGGRWKRDGTQMIFYKADNITEIGRFNLLDIDGNSASESEDVFERTRV